MYGCNFGPVWDFGGASAAPGYTSTQQIQGQGGLSKIHWVYFAILQDMTLNFFPSSSTWASLTRYWISLERCQEHAYRFQPILSVLRIAWCQILPSRSLSTYKASCVHHKFIRNGTKSNAGVLFHLVGILFLCVFRSRPLWIITSETALGSENLANSLTDTTK